MDPHAGCSFAAHVRAGRTRSGIDAELAAYGYLWAWTENQMICAVKLLPLGQTAGQRLLESIRLQMPQIVAAALAVDDEEIGAATPLHGDGQRLARNPVHPTVPLLGRS